MGRGERDEATSERRDERACAVLATRKYERVSGVFALYLSPGGLDEDSDAAADEHGDIAVEVSRLAEDALGGSEEEAEERRVRRGARS